MKIEKSSDSHLVGKNTDAKWKNKAQYYKIRVTQEGGGGVVPRAIIPFHTKVPFIANSFMSIRWRNANKYKSKNSFFGKHFCINFQRSSCKYRFFFFFNCNLCFFTKIPVIMRRGDELNHEKFTAFFYAWKEFVQTNLLKNIDKSVFGKFSDSLLQVSRNRKSF